jgi:hypothetical protein
VRWIPVEWRCGGRTIFVFVSVALSLACSLRRRRSRYQNCTRFVSLLCEVEFGSNPSGAREYQSRWRTTDPITGGSTAVLHMVSDHYSGIAQIFYNPPKGIINTMTSIPQGMLDLVVGLHEGFESVPRLLGSRVRERGPVENFGTGVIEGGKGLWWGWWDGITGLVTEPVEGARKEVSG